MTLSLSASDDTGVTAYYAAETSTTPSASDTGWTTVTSAASYSEYVSFTLTGGNSTKTVYVWFKDAAGNISASASDSITLSVLSFSMAAIPDTGQTTSFTNTFGEDSDYTINPPSYTDNGDGTVTDNVTTLMWQQQDDNTRRTWAGAGTYCDSLTLAGNSDWRLPSYLELASIADSEKYDPAINQTYFPFTSSSSYWSSTTRVDNTSGAWLVNFYDGNVYYYSRSRSLYARCVRGGQ